MNQKIDELNRQHYDAFHNVLIGQSVLVRENQLNDAFELTVLQIMYGNLLNLDFNFDRNHPNTPKNQQILDDIAQYIVPANVHGDGGIDILVKNEYDDQPTLHLIQVKNAALTPEQIRAALDKMKSTVAAVVRNQPIKSAVCREMLLDAGLDAQMPCQYYVVYRDDQASHCQVNADEHVLTDYDLVQYLESPDGVVREATFNVTTTPLSYQDPLTKQTGMVVNLNGYELAKLNNDWCKSDAGLSTLYAANLRGPLSNKRNNRTYPGMENTIKKNPQKFWFFNNGVTIIAKQVRHDATGNQLILRDFTIVNGAQTTSSLGRYLESAHGQTEVTAATNALKQVSVLARVLQINDDQFKDDIAIFTNTHNPIDERDMVANRPEQIALAQRLAAQHPPIFMLVKNGEKLPKHCVRPRKHRLTQNDKLGKLALAAFLKQTYYAINRKKELFKRDIVTDATGTEIYQMNETYRSIFEQSNGILWQKTPAEIDEALFVEMLFGECYLRYQNFCQTTIHNLQAKHNEAAVNEMAEKLAIAKRSGYYFVAMYYQFREYANATKHLDGERYYTDKTFRDNLVEKACQLFLEPVIEMIQTTATTHGKDCATWLRGKDFETEFFNTAVPGYLTKMGPINDFNQFVNDFMV